MYMFTSGWSRLENEVADEWIERDNKETFNGKDCCWPKRTNAIQSYCFSIFFLIKALIILGGTIV